MPDIIHTEQTDWMEQARAIEEVKNPSVQPWKDRPVDHVSMERDRQREAEGLPCWKIVAHWFRPVKKKP